MIIVFRALTVALAVALCTIAAHAQAPTRDQLGRDVKLRILVDKVMQPVAGWTTEEWMIEEAADAGFNVFSPRIGYDNLEAVEQVTRWCEEQGIYHQVWIRGTLEVSDPEAAQGRMLVWRNGGEQPLYSPNADELWDWLTRYCVEYARISAEDPHLMGVFLDYENYAAGVRMSGTVYDLSYDQMTLDMFAEEEGVEIPDLAPADRYQWLVDNDLHDAFDAWQVAHWRERCKALREAVDEIDPDFQFCMYPAPGSRFMLEGAFPEWTNERAPVIFADAATYGRPASFLPEQGALTSGRRTLEERQAQVAEMGLPSIYTGGIDPVVEGADAEYSGKNAVMISDVTDGYWIFYEGPTYATTHPEYFKWFAWANEAIEAGWFEKQHAPRETPDEWAFSAIGTGETGLMAPEATGEVVEFPPVPLRSRNLLLINARADQPVEITAESYQIGPTLGDIAWEAYDLTWEQLGSGTIPAGTPGSMTFEVPADGIYAIVMHAAGSSYSLLSANVPVGIVAKNTAIIGAAERLYFSVPAGTEQFSITGRSFGAETMRLNVYDPAGELVTTGQTTPAVEVMALDVQPGEAAGDVWAVEVARADEGVLEDVRVSLGAGLPTIFALVPEHVFVKQ